MANEQVVDELVVKLTLDNKDYVKKDKERQKTVDTTEKSEKRADTERDKRAKKRKKLDNEDKRSDTERQKRLGQTERAVKSLGSTLKAFALTTAAVFGIGAGVSGIVGAITNLAGFETGLRRAAVSTGMSNREMQAWGATAKRLGADADSGAAAIAALAREQKQFNLTGSGPTMQALARLGVNVSPNAKPEDMLEQAQQIYRRSAPAQQQQIEAQLSAQGVSDDLIVMIKSETDAREAYTRSLADSVEENKASMAALNDAMTSVKQASLQLANVIATAATPYIQEFSNWVQSIASDPHQLDTWISKTSDAFRLIGKASSVLSDALNDFWADLKPIVDGFNNKSNTVKDWFNKPTSDFQNHDGSTSASLFLRRMLHSAGIGSDPDAIQWNTGAAPTNAPNAAVPWWRSSAGMPTNSGQAMPVSSQDFMNQLVARGLTPAQAMAATANALREAPGKMPGTIDPGAVNASSGASGVFQWLGPRKAQFQSIFGMTPDQAPLDTQLDFLFGNATETARMQKAFAGGGSASDMAQRFNDIFEANGVAGEGIKRAQLAAQLAGQTGAASGTDTAGGTQINLNGPVTVKADNPQELVGNIQRIAQVQNYQTAMR